MPNLEKLEKIENVLRENPEGLWVVKVSELTGIAESTILYYVTGQIKNNRLYGAFLKNKTDHRKEGKNHIVSWRNGK